MKNTPTYENDKDLEPLIFGELTEEKVLTFFFKKKGRVNWNNLSHQISERRGENIAPILKELEGKGLIKMAKYPLMKLTGKARWIKTYTNPKWQFWAAIASIIAVLISIAAIWISSKQN